MAQRVRHSTARPTGGRPSVAPTPSRSSVPTELPTYRKPSHPLNLNAQRRLRDLVHDQSLSLIKEHNTRAEVLITKIAGEINDMTRAKEERTARRRKKWEKGINVEEREEEERKLKELQSKVDDMTIQLEESMRAVIDNDVAAQRITQSLEWLQESAPEELRREYATQKSQRDSQIHSQSQRRQRSQRDGDGDEDMDVDEDESTPGPTLPEGSRIALTGPSELFKNRSDQKKNEYTSHSHKARYAKNNTYIGFKNIVHDAKYGDDGPNLPHPDHWFTEAGEPAHGVTQHGNDSDDDLVMDRGTISVRCPLTFLTFKDPYTSKKCPHSFEKDPILEMIRQSKTMLGGGGQRGQGHRAVKCPVTGCEQMLTASDLAPDPILIRKIKRIQQAEAQNDQESDADSEDDVPQVPRSQIDGSMEIEEPVVSRHSVVKREARESVVPATQQPPQSSKIEDLGSEEDDGEEEEEEEEEV
ncbi:zinc-finger of the MIZ type in Nse subunit-domain-containing protein [Massariosphaeria phaeospora]|uniref:Zinc-finger of the MIZ type in Nse subunit-domain-containing protein n=1 Tax=Massariosphaeria phaeospora TaxID=100035 RepID=A0A7C8IDA0_9PLEO|nr:zinc-finger of the MIZ type in Nse subunit-domain-containing protein [Massariosphaeria phaeospora]